MGLSKDYETTETKTKRGKLIVKQTACFRLILRGETTSEATDASLSWGGDKGLSYIHVGKTKILEVSVKFQEPPQMF